MKWSWKPPDDWQPKLIILVLIGIAGAATYRAKTLPEMTEARLLAPGREAPDFSLRGVDGRIHRLAELRGKAVVLNFMATWCGPCAAELPILVRFAREHGGDPIAIVGIDYDEPALTVERFARERGLNYSVLVDDGGVVAASYGIGAFPTTYLIDSKGIIRLAYAGSFEGPAGDWTFRRFVEMNLGEFISAARRERKHCSPPSVAAPSTLARSEEMSWALSRVACACGCSAKLLDCDCGEKRGGREIREYYARLRMDPDLSVPNARQIVVWKYKDEYAW